MINLIRYYVKIVDAINYRIGRIVMYGIFIMLGILLWSSISKTFFDPALWTLDMAKFSMSAYFILGGAYSIQMGSNVRMDLFYGEWSAYKKAWFDVFTALFLMFYLGVLLYGGVDSTSYSFQYWERGNSIWRPYMWPIKVTMLTGIVLMLLQVISEFFKDVATIRGVKL